MFQFKDKNGKILTVKEVLQKAVNRISNIFLDFELLILRLSGHIPSHTFRLFIYRLVGIKIGKGSRIHMWCTFFNPRNIKIGEDTIIGDHCFLDGRASLEIGSHTAISSSVYVYNSQHDIDSLDFQAKTSEVIIGDYVFIGPRSIILPGVRLGRGACIGAGSVVTKNAETMALYAGVPAKFIRKRQITETYYRLGRARLFQ